MRQTRLMRLRRLVWRASRSSLGCHIIEMARGGVGMGSLKVTRLFRDCTVCFSGTWAIQSEALTSSSAELMLGTTAMTERLEPRRRSSSSMGPWKRPLRETLMCGNEV